jgi:hypothetical protein
MTTEESLLDFTFPTVFRGPYPVGTGAFLLARIKLVIHFHHVSRLRMHGTIPPLNYTSYCRDA